MHSNMHNMIIIKGIIICTTICIIGIIIIGVVIGIIGITMLRIYRIICRFSTGLHCGLSDHME